MSTTTQAPHTRALEALREYLQLRDELGELEARESECTCDVNEFHACQLCELAKEKMLQSRGLMDLWGDNWAVLLNRTQPSLPFQAWCDCGHISGQHAAAYPHECAVANGCEKECYGFHSRLISAAAEMLEALERCYKAIEALPPRWNEDRDEPLRMAWAAIQKAKGAL